MPRSRSSSSKRSLSSKSTPSASAPAPPPPARSKAPPPTVQQQQHTKGGGMLQGLGSTIMEGFAFGTGSAIARQAVGAVFGGSSSSHPQQDHPQQANQSPAPPIVQHMDRPPERVMVPLSAGACEMDHTAFNNCMNENGHQISSCDFLFQALQQCQNDNNNTKFSTAV